ncbi:hypothetical protein AZF37_00650 [endosymbiont 'TC1' of Trimyema compressum]|uniref:FAD-dependent oxidoreductase n=1 Tax=endosymbiont 'TC1' of Trimyema compressum TaxID=243899 RepID=UPI0007F0C542|nr:FAD-dependent oxidoreductase [endosymbiont 'TC1' of Trimyema compressum]AMP19882.1 hypothetical protein AZF37_00650 [endosymbiont 'TC1' of Trimyema compressum]
MDKYDEYNEIPQLNYTTQNKYLDNITAGQWLRKNGVQEKYISKYNVTTKGLFGANMDEISALNFIPEAAFDYEDVSYEETVDYSKFSDKDIENEYFLAKKEKSSSYSFEKGVTELTNKLGEVLGDKIRKNSKVVSVTKKGEDYLVEYMGNGENSRQVLANKIVLAVPSTEETNIASTVITEEKAHIMKQIEYSSYATVALFF